jgi:ABC-type Fe3+ transport system substrate-binding protein
MAGVRAVALTESIRRVGSGLVLWVALLLAGCDDGRTRLVVRTDLPDALRDAVEEAFEAQAPDVDVRFDVKGPEETFADLVAAEADGAARAPDFDVWWGAPAVLLERAARAGWVGEWRAVLSTPFVVVFDRNDLGLADAPRDWIDVFHHGYFEEVAIPDPARSEMYRELVGAIVAAKLRTEGEAYIGFEWLERLDGQVARYVPDEREALRGLRTGQALLAIVRRSAVEEAGDDELHYRVPESGAPLDVLGVGTIEGTAAADAAARFFAYLVSSEAPAVEELLPGWERFVPVADGATFPVATALVADSLDVWMSRWSRDVRGRGK